MHYLTRASPQVSAPKTESIMHDTVLARRTLVRERRGWVRYCRWRTASPAAPRCIPNGQRSTSYCLAPAARQENAKPLTMVAVGVNKSAEQYEVLDERTRQAMAEGRYHDQRRALLRHGRRRRPLQGQPPRQRARCRPRVRRPPRRPERRTPARRAWTQKQENLALIYHEQGLRPEEIARRWA